MPVRSMRRVPKLPLRCPLPVLLAALCGCGGGGGNDVPDAAVLITDARPATDAAAGSDSASSESLTWVDFAISGCDPDQSADAVCRGSAPLALQFTAIAPAAVDVYVWDLGVDTEGQPPIAVPNPRFTYALPGLYDVVLTVRGPGGTAELARPGVIEVEAAALGASCTLDAQCGEAASCLCGADTEGASTCPSALQSGLCSVSCGPDSGCASGVCADLAASQPSDPAPWQAAMCLPACGPEGDCPAGLLCQALPAGDAEDGWVEACFAPNLLAPVGGSCRGADGSLRDQRCAGGLCLDIGARGACSAPCDTRACPTSAACARFSGDDRDVCVARCQGESCADDPWLACEPAGAAQGFEVISEPPDPAGYCTPRTCEEASECGPDGACTAGFCGPA